LCDALPHAFLRFQHSGANSDDLCHRRSWFLDACLLAVSTTTALGAAYFWRDHRSGRINFDASGRLCRRSVACALCGIVFPGLRIRNARGVSALYRNALCPISLGLGVSLCISVPGISKYGSFQRCPGECVAPLCPSDGVRAQYLDYSHVRRCRGLSCNRICRWAHEYEHCVSSCFCNDVRGRTSLAFGREISAIRYRRSRGGDAARTIVDLTDRKRIVRQRALRCVKACWRARPDARRKRWPERGLRQPPFLVPLLQITG